MTYTDAKKEVVVTCASLDCPERKGGLCRHAQPPVEGWEDIDSMLATFKMYNGTYFCALCGLDPKKLREGIRTLIASAERRGEVAGLTKARELVLALAEHYDPETNPGQQVDVADILEALPK